MFEAAELWRAGKGGVKTPAHAAKGEWTFLRNSTSMANKSSHIPEVSPFFKCRSAWSILLVFEH